MSVCVEVPAFLVQRDSIAVVENGKKDFKTNGISLATVQLILEYHSLEKKHLTEHVTADVEDATCLKGADCVVFVFGTVQSLQCFFFEHSTQCN